MSFMNAKEARPVDDPKALVPFGWAPGNYHCAACSICGEAHSGSDKRSMRCQDCAETLRDKQASEPAPTTRETADHVELAAMKPEDHRVRAVMLACESRMKGYETPIHAADAKFALDYLLSEIAALRGELSQSKREYRDDVGKHIARAAQAKRQRDELRAALEPFADEFGAGIPRPDDFQIVGNLNLGHFRRATEAIANQGADQ